MPTTRMPSLLCVLLLALPVGMSQTPPPASGDWIIADSTTISNETVDLAGNLIVKAGGRLVLDNVILNMNCGANGQYTIKVEKDGYAWFNGTTVTCPAEKLYYKFQIHGDAVITYSTIEKVWGIQASIPYWQGGIEIYSDRVTIEWSTVRNCFGNGIMINSSSPTIRHCTILDHGWRAILCRGNATPIIEWNSISNSFRGVVNTEYSHPKISNNTIIDNLYSGIMNFNNSCAHIERNEIIRNGNIGIQNTDYSNTTIIDNIIADNGDIVGNRGGGIANANSSKAIIDGNIITNNSCGFHNIGPTEIFIKNNKINKNNYGIYDIDDIGCLELMIDNNNISECNYDGIYIKSSGTRIINNTINDCDGHCIRVIDASNVVIDNNSIFNSEYCGIFNENSSLEICNNSIYDNFFHGLNNNNSTVIMDNNKIYDNMNGIRNAGTSGAKITNNDIYANRGAGVLNAGQSHVEIIDENKLGQNYIGIVYNEYAFGTVKNNTIFGSITSGIGCFDSSNPNIVSNIIGECGACGISLANCATTFITNNKIINNTESGIDCAGHCIADIVNNTITGSGGAGIDASDSSTLRTVRKNIITNTLTAMEVADSANVSADNNTLEGNQNGVVLDSGRCGFSDNAVSGGAFGFKIVDCSPTLAGNRISGAGCGYQLINSSPTITGSAINNAKDCSIHCSEGSFPEVVNSTIVSTVEAMDFIARDGSGPVALNTLFAPDRVKIYDSSYLTVKWYLQLDIMDSKSRPLDLANVSVNGPRPFRTATDSNGTAGWLPVEDQTIQIGGARKAVHSIVVEKNGDSNRYDNVFVNRSGRRELRFDFSPGIASIPDQLLDEDSQSSLDLSAYCTDLDNDPDDLRYSICPGGDAGTNLTLTGSVVRFTYSLPDAGDLVLFNVSDGLRNATGKFRVRVNETNDAPVFPDPGPVECKEDEIFILDLGRYIHDEEDELETLTIECNSGFASLHGLELLLCYPEGMTDERITVTVRDTQGKTCQRILYVLIEPVNDLPELADIPEIRPVEDVELIVDLSAYLKDPDTDFASITFSTDSRYCRVVGQKLIFNYPEGILDDAFNLTLSDGLDNATFRLETRIRPVNDPPVLLTVPTINIVAGNTTTIDLKNLIFDPDTPRSDIALWSTSPHAKVSGTSLILSYPRDTSAGKKMVTIRLTDGNASNTIGIPVNVTASPPKGPANPPSNLYLYILLPLSIIGTAAGILVHRRVRYGWYRMKRAMLVNTDGRLLAHVGDMGDAEDEMLVSSMLTAVQQFINEVMKKEKAGAIKEFMYEDLKIAIEGGERIYLAVFIEGYATDRLRKKMKEIVSSMEKKYSLELATWDGRITDEFFITEAKTRLVTLKEGK